MLPSLQKLRLAAGRTGAPQKNTRVDLDSVMENLSRLAAQQQRGQALRQALAEGDKFYDEVASHLNATRACNDALKELLLDEEGQDRLNLSQADLERAKAVVQVANEEAQKAMNRATVAMNVPKDWPPELKREVRNGPASKAYFAAKEAVQLADAATQWVEEAVARREFLQLVGSQGPYEVVAVPRPDGRDPKQPLPSENHGWREHAGEQSINYGDRGGRRTRGNGDQEGATVYHNDLHPDAEMEDRYVLKAEHVELYTKEVMQLMRSMDATSKASVSSEESEEDGDESDEDGDESYEDGDNPALDGGPEEPSGSKSATDRPSRTPDEQRLQNANMRYRQVRCWLKHLGEEGVPAGLGLWLTNDEISTIEMQARLASVQWAREGTDADHIKAGHAKASPVFWAIMLALQTLAARNKSRKVEVKKASYLVSKEKYDARTFYTLKEIHEYFGKHFQKTKCEDKAPQNVANTKVYGQLSKTQYLFVDTRRTNVLRWDALGNDTNIEKKAHTLDRLLRRAAAAAEYEQTKRRVLRSSAQGAAAGGGAAPENGDAAQQLEKRAVEEATEAARRAFNEPENGLFDSVRTLSAPTVVDGVVPDAEMKSPIRLVPDDQRRKPAPDSLPAAPPPPNPSLDWGERPDEERPDLARSKARSDNVHKEADDRLAKMAAFKGADKQTAPETPKRKGVTQPTETAEDRARKDTAKALKTEEKRKVAVAREATRARTNAVQLARRATEAEKALQVLLDARARAPTKTRTALDVKVRIAKRAYDAASKLASAALQEAEAKEAAASMAPAGNPELDGGEE